MQTTPSLPYLNFLCYRIPVQPLLIIMVHFQHTGIPNCQFRPGSPLNTCMTRLTAIYMYRFFIIITRVMCTVTMRGARCSEDVSTPQHGRRECCSGCMAALFGDSLILKLNNSWNISGKNETDLRSIERAYCDNRHTSCCNWGIRRRT